MKIKYFSFLFKVGLIKIMFFSSFLLAVVQNDEFDQAFDEAFDSEWQDEPAYLLSNEVSYGYAKLLDSNSINLENNVFNELRVKSELVYKADSYTFNLDIELFDDELLNKTDFDVYQFNFLIPFDNGTDLKVGRQVITWGTGDLVFLNDLFAKDWQSFFNGREDTYLKPPIDALRISHYGAEIFGNKVNFDIAILPKFAADNTLTGERYSFYMPNQGIIQPDPILTVVKPNKPEISARLFANHQGIEWAAYVYSGYFKSPSVINSFGELGFSKMRSIGASIRMPLGGGLFNSEFSIYQSVDDQLGDNPFIANGQSRFLLGYETEIADQLILASQFYLEKISDHQSLNNNLPNGFEPSNDNRNMLTFRFTQQALQQKLTNSLMLFYSETDDDYFLRYSSLYKITDNWKVVAGLNWLDGKTESTFLAQMQDNSNLYFRVHYNF